MFYNVKEGQLKLHTNHKCALIEAQRLSNTLNADILTVEVINVTTPEEYAPNAGQPWTQELDSKLLYMYMSGKNTPRELAKYFGRTAWAIVCRLQKFKIQDVYEDTNYRGW